MIKMNDYFVYGTKGVCHLDDICEKSDGSQTRTYYVFHPVVNSGNKIMIPTVNPKIAMRPLINKEEAVQVIETFREPLTMEWSDNKKVRDKEFGDITKNGPLTAQAQLLKLLFLRQQYMKAQSKRFSDTDNRLLTTLQRQLFCELSLVLEKPYEEVEAAFFTALEQVM